MRSQPLIRCGSTVTRNMKAKENARCYLRFASLFSAKKVTETVAAVRWSPAERQLKISAIPPQRKGNSMP